MSRTEPIGSQASSRLLLLAAGVGGALLAGVLGLWAAYGSAVFFEMIAAGLQTCF